MPRLLVNAKRLWGVSLGAGLFLAGTQETSSPVSQTHQIAVPGLLLVSRVSGKSFNLFEFLFPQ